MEAGRPRPAHPIHEPGSFHVILHPFSMSSKRGKKGFGFVFESNGYMCLLVGTDITADQSLLPAIESMTIDKRQTIAICG